MSEFLLGVASLFDFFGVLNSGRVNVQRQGWETLSTGLHPGVGDHMWQETSFDEERRVWVTTTYFGPVSR